MLRRGDELYGVECKRADAPRVTTSIKHALVDLDLTRVAVVYPGNKTLLASGPSGSGAIAKRGYRGPDI